MKTKGQIEASICEAMTRFEQTYMGRGPQDIQSFLLDDMVVVRLHGVLTAAEQQLAQSMPSDKGRDILKQVRTHLLETARPLLETTVKDITGIETTSMHHDISTVTGEEVITFTLASTVPTRQSKSKSK